jgi:hypothetical protein
MFTVKSTRLKLTLRRLQQQWRSAGKIAAVIRVPPEMIWWYWQEWGTGVYAEKGTKPGNEVGYFVPAPENTEANILLFYNQDGQLIYREEVFVFGIPAKHMVGSVEKDAREILKEGTRKALKERGYNPEALRSHLLDELMPRIKELIRRSFESNLSSEARDRGRLPVSPAEEFESKAKIEPL